MTTPTATPSAGEPVALLKAITDYLNNSWDSYEGNPWYYEEQAQHIVDMVRDALTDPYPWLARGAIPPYQPPFPGEAE